MVKTLIIRCYVPETKNFIIYKTIAKNNSISCPICGRWYANYYIRFHMMQIHSKYAVEIKEE